MALVFGQMNETPGARMRVSHVSLTMAEYFRDALHQDVLIFIDNVFRFLQAGSEVSTLLGRMPSAVGYQPTLCTEMGSIQDFVAEIFTRIQGSYVSLDETIMGLFVRRCILFKRYNILMLTILATKLDPEGVTRPRREPIRKKRKDAILAKTQPLIFA